MNKNLKIWFSTYRKHNRCPEKKESVVFCCLFSKKLMNRYVILSKINDDDDADDVGGNDGGCSNNDVFTLVVCMLCWVCALLSVLARYHQITLPIFSLGVRWICLTRFVCQSIANIILFVWFTRMRLPVQNDSWFVHLILLALQCIANVVTMVYLKKNHHIFCDAKWMKW